MSNYTGDPTKGLKLTLDLPQDASKPKSDEFNKVLGPLLDNIAYLNARGVQGSAIRVCTMTNLGSLRIGPAGNAGTWQNFPTALGLTPYVNITECQVTDKLIAFFTSRIAINAQTDADMRFMAEEDYGGAGVTAAFQGGQTRIHETSDDGELVFMVGQRIIQTAGTCRVWLQGKNSLGGSSQVGIAPESLTTTMLVVRLRSYEIL